MDVAGTIDVLSGLTDFSNSDQGSGSYVVEDGDTLQTIAQETYGDPSLWYVIADANGLQASSALTPGQTLKIPQVTTTDNTANTFKPYNPNEIQGSTTPSLPQAPQPPPSAQHCSTLAMIVVIAVVVVASIFTAGVAAEAFAGTLGSTGVGGIMAAGGAAFTGGAAVGTVAATATAGDMLGAFAASAAIGGAVGNAAGQLVGDAEGVHSGFSWTEMLGAGLTAAAGAGIGSVVRGGGALLEAKGELTTAGSAVVGAADYAAGVGVDKVVGEPTHFSWAGLAANAAGAAVAHVAHLPANSDNPLNSSVGQVFEGHLVDDVVTRETSVALGDIHVQSWK